VPCVVGHALDSRHMNLCADWVRLGLGPYAAWMELGMCSEFSDRAAEADGNFFFF
jgi:hypothetical protein